MAEATQMDTMATQAVAEQGRLAQLWEGTTDWMHEQGRKVAIVGLAVGVTAVAVACGGSRKESGKKPTAADNGEIAAALTVKTTAVDCVATVQDVYGADRVAKVGDQSIVRFSDSKGNSYIGSLLGVEPNGPRRWSDALTTPYKADKNDKAAMLKETEAEICENPLVGVTVASMFANMKVEGVSVVELNDWLKPYADASLINDKAKEFVPLLGKTGKVSDQEAQTALTKAHDYQGLAELLDTILTKFANDGVGTQETTFNYHLKGGGLMVATDKLPEVELNGTQAKAEALRLKLTSKTNGCITIIGFNTGDKRPEGFACQVVVAPKPKATTKPQHRGRVTIPPRKQQRSTTTSMTTGTTSTTIPHKLVTTSTTPTTLRQKDPSEDQKNNQGSPNVGQGSGGQVGPEGTTTTTARKKPAESTTTTVAITSTTQGECGDPCK